MFSQMSTTLSREADRQHVAHLRIDFNDLNLLSVPEAQALRDALRSVPEDIAVLTISPEASEKIDAVRGLSAGLDLEWAHTLDAHEGQALLTAFYEMIEAVRNLDAVVICDCGSYTLGVGFELAMACEFRIATEDARLGLPEVNVGIPTVIHGGLLTRLVGLQTATELLYTGRTLSGERARELDLVNRAVEPEEYDDALGSLVSELAAKSPQALQSQKRVMRRFRSVGLERGMEASIGDMGRVFGTHEQREAMTAFLEDREPEFEL